MANATAHHPRIRIRTKMSRIRNTGSNAVWLTIIVVDPYWLPSTENCVPCVVGNIILHAQLLQWMAPFLDFCNIPSSHRLNKLFLNLKAQSHALLNSLEISEFRILYKTTFDMLWYYLIINILIVSTKSVLFSQWLQEISTKYPCHRRLCIYHSRWRISKRFTERISIICKWFQRHKY